MAAPGQAADSLCYGTPANGRLENGAQLPSGGANFSLYSRLGALLGRTYVHSRVAEVVVTAYARLAEVLPEHVFVLGETGWKTGGRIRPHRTHQNGLSVDFMVPVLDADGRSVALAGNALNRWGYDLEFDADGRLGELRIDFDAMAEHLYQLVLASRAHGIGIRRVYFDPQLQPGLHRSPRWRELAVSLPLSATQSWVRHDEHYHVDFDVECER